MAQGVKRKREDEERQGPSGEEDKSQMGDARGARDDPDDDGERGQRANKSRKAQQEEQWAHIAIAKQALEWTPKKRQTGSLRTKWPLVPMVAFDTADFESYLRNTLGLKESTVGIHAQKMKYFMGMLDVTYPASHIEIIAGIYRSGRRDTWGAPMKLRQLVW